MDKLGLFSPAFRAVAFEWFRLGLILAIPFEWFTAKFTKPLASWLPGFA